MKWCPPKKGKRGPQKKKGGGKTPLCEKKGAQNLAPQKKENLFSPQKKKGKNSKKGRRIKIPQRVSPLKGLKKKGKVKKI